MWGMARWLQVQQLLELEPENEEYREMLDNLQEVRPRGLCGESLPHECSHDGPAPLMSHSPLQQTDSRQQQSNSSCPHALRVKQSCLQPVSLPPPPPILPALHR